MVQRQRRKTTAILTAMVAFGEAYGEITRDDHRFFVDAFRNHLFPDL
jgi:hypothetical protein